MHQTPQFRKNLARFKTLSLALCAGGVQLIDLGAAADFGGTALGVKLGAGPHDPLYCPTDPHLLPEGACTACT